jgi:hypothetical protein
MPSSHCWKVDCHIFVTLSTLAHHLFQSTMNFVQRCFQRGVLLFMLARKARHTLVQSS